MDTSLRRLASQSLQRTYTMRDASGKHQNWTSFVNTDTMAKDRTRLTRLSTADVNTLVASWLADTHSHHLRAVHPAGGRELMRSKLLRKDLPGEGG